jgi:cytochrome c-type biogenesis protein CcsB
MNSTDLNTYLTFGYLACWIFALISCSSTSPDSKARKLVFWILVGLWVLLTGSIGLRWIESYQQGIGHAPLSNLYESIIFFAWTMALALILTRWKFRADTILLLGLPLVFLMMASPFLMDLDTTIKPLIPALQSNWLVAHVFTCFLGYAGFAVSFVAAVAFLATGGSKGTDKAGRNAEILDQIVYKAILVGFPLLTIGIVTGAAWADYAWGSYWSWDPKETWSLITWLVYSAFLHARIARGWSGSRTAALSLLGFGAVLFTYLGVNWLGGLHSYF